MPRRTRLLAALFTLAALIAATAAQASGAPVCATGSVGGSWPLYGHDLSNTRTANDTGIDAAKAASLTAKWVFNVAAKDGSGNINSTPTVADGCVFFATDGGDVFVLNADTGAVVWHNQYVVGATRLGGTIASAVAIDHGLAIIDVSDAGHPYVTAVNELTGVEVWRATVDHRPGSFINASPVPFNGMVFVGFAGDEYSPLSRGGFAIVRESDGAILKTRYTIPDADFNAGYWGGSIWSSAAVDARAGYAYAGTGNPSSHDKEHANTDAVLKIDVHPDRATFGQIVAVYKGVSDHYVDGLDKQPACEKAPDVTYGDAWSVTCVQFDLDFGASPTLYKDAKNATMVGALQKAGVLHGIEARTMKKSWSTIVGTPCFVCNAASPANDKGSIAAAATTPGQLVSLDGSTGGYKWISPLADGIHFESVSIANGLVYAPDFYGNLNVFDEATGVPLLKRNMALDTGAQGSGTSSSGISIARHTVYAPAAGYLVAYK
ncbi:MAG: hypothetical protein NVSMB57_09270 [Actinomycetota bacterium]